MPGMTESLGGLAHSIAQQRRDRAEATRARRTATDERSKAVLGQLREIRTARGVAGGEYRRASHATRAMRSKDVGGLLGHFHATLQARHRDRLEQGATLRRQLAAFMTGLTASVGSLRDRFRTELDELSSSQRAELSGFLTGLNSSVGGLRAGFRADLDRQRAALRASARDLHQQLDAARRDRQGANDAWRGRKHAAAAVAPARPAATDRHHARAEPARHAEPAAAARPRVKEAEPAPKPPASPPRPTVFAAPHAEPATPAAPAPTAIARPQPAAPTPAAASQEGGKSS